MTPSFACLAALALVACVHTPLQAPRFGMVAFTPPVTFNVPAAYVDPGNASGNASDANPCTAATAPCATFAEVERRLGLGGTLTASLTLFMLSDGVQADPLNIHVAIPSGMVLHLYCAPDTTLGSGATAVQTGTFSAVTSLSRAQGSRLRRGALRLSRNHTVSHRGPRHDLHLGHGERLPGRDLA
jgi:hypothetical protein